MFDIPPSPSGPANEMMIQPLEQGLAQGVDYCSELQLAQHPLQIPPGDGILGDEIPENLEGLLHFVRWKRQRGGSGVPLNPEPLEPLLRFQTGLL